MSEYSEQTTSTNNWEAILAETLGAFLSGKLSFVVDDIAVTISSSSGTPVKFSLATAIFAAESVFLGSTGQLQVGSVLITLAPQAPSESNASEQSLAIASAIAKSVLPSGPASIGVPVVAAAPAIVPAQGMTSALQPGPAAYPVHAIAHGHTAP
jgi:hypothetical protein